jgi:glycosyltransferase involved in cell wall biosynthesis
LAKEIGVSGRVEWPGRIARERLAHEYGRANLLLVPSRYEPFGIVIIEAMASGLPVIASDVDGVPYVVNGGECAKLVEPGNVSALAQAIRDLATNPDEARRLRKAGLRRVSEFDAKAGVGKWLDIFQELAATRRSR